MERSDSGEVISGTYIGNVYRAPEEHLYWDNYLLVPDPIFTKLRRIVGVIKKGELVKDETIVRVKFPNHESKKFRKKWHETPVKKIENPPTINRYTVVGKQPYAYIDGKSVFATRGWMSGFEIEEDGEPVLFTTSSVGADEEWFRERSGFHDYFKPIIRFGIPGSESYEV